MGFDATFLANSTLAPAQASNEQQQFSWRIGTTPAMLVPMPRAPTAHILSLPSGATVKVPEVSFSYLSSGASYVPPSPGSPPPMMTTTTTSSSSPTPSPTKTSISSNSAFCNDFSSGSMAQWTTYGGSFAASSSALVGSNSIGGKALINSNYENFLYEVDVTLPSTSGNAGLIFCVTNPGDDADAYNGYFCRYFCLRRFRATAGRSLVMR